jgi:light-regulated signal transduction histidine kinase (bacteriophytochrome)
VGVVVVDFTDRKRAEEGLKGLADDLAESNRELEQFAYIASHDLQEPLRMVSNYMGLVSKRYRDKFDSDGLEYMNYAIDGARRMRELIQGLLEYCRVGQTSQEFSMVESEKVFHDVIADLQIALKESQAEIQTCRLPTLYGDEMMLRQLFQNLLSNAAKFRGDQQLRITINCVDNGSEWLFSVADNGIGFEMAHATRMFTLFQRLHRGGEYPGTGMGLALCKKIVERHGGRIWAKSEVGKGSTFFFTIPHSEVARLSKKRAELSLGSIGLQFYES